MLPYTTSQLEDNSDGHDTKDVIHGGDDFVDAEDGRGLAADVISCGAGRDTVLVDKADRPSWDCEVVR